MPPIAKLFYSIEDNFPPYRVDLVELYFKELGQRGDLDLVWHMRRGKPGPGGKVQFEGQDVYLPPQAGGRRIIAAPFTKLAFWLSNAVQLFKHAWFTPYHIQVRDQFTSALLGLIAARLSGKKFFYWCSYPFPEHYLERAKRESGLKKLYSWLMGYAGWVVLYRLVMPRADHNFVQSDRMLSDLAAIGVPAERMTAVPMGVPKRLLEFASQAGVGRSMAVDPNRVAYLGTLVSVRRLEDLLKAFARVVQTCPQAKLVMVGEGDSPRDRAGLEALAAELGIGHAVEFTGFLPIEDAWRIAAGAAVCVSPYPCVRELMSGSPTKLVEYMALGRPVVCNDHPEQKSITEQSGAGLCTPWDVAAFAQAIEWMLTHREEAEAMGARGPGWVARHRTYDVLAAGVLASYRKLFGVPG